MCDELDEPTDYREYAWHLLHQNKNCFHPLKSPWPIGKLGLSMLNLRGKYNIRKALLCDRAGARKYRKAPASMGVYSFPVLPGPSGWPWHGCNNANTQSGVADMPLVQNWNIKVYWQGTNLTTAAPCSKYRNFCLDPKTSAPETSALALQLKALAAKQLLPAVSPHVSKSTPKIPD